MNTRSAASTLAHLVASGLCSGLSPVSPGTVGSAALVLVWLVLHSFDLLPHLLVEIAFGAGLCWAGVASVGRYLQDHPEADDPGFIVIDEWAGMAIALIGTSPSNPTQIFVAFALFRLLDITKPWLIGKAELLPRAWGIMVDDIVAGAATFVVLLPWKG